MGYRWEKKGKREANEVLLGRRNFLFLRAGPADMAGDDRDSPTPGACPLTMTGPRRAPIPWQCHALALLVGHHVSLHPGRRRGEPVC